LNVFETISQEKYFSPTHSNLFFLTTGYPE
jgi:hypothetical protein